MNIGLAYDLKTSVEIQPGAPEDAVEEYDPPSTIDALASEIERQGHHVTRLGGGVEFLEKIRDARIDLVFNIAEGRGIHRSREAQVPSILEMLGFSYVGSDPLTLAICLDKPMAKRVAISAGVNTPRYHVVESIEDLEALKSAALKFPAVVKPSFEGSSKGIRLTSRVDRWEDLFKPVATVLSDYRQPALVEEYIAGTEITVGVVGNAPPRVVGVMEVVPRLASKADFMYTLEVKRDWERQVAYRCPPELPASCIAELEAAALALFKVLGCRDMARLDFRVDAENRVYFLEANPLPGLSPLYSDLPVMAGLCGWSYTRLIETILNSALERTGLARSQNANRIAV
ncbi:MAG: D-alanine--D-alanine ligase [Chloroflexi bacterium]|nr:D-alanine--D-alanine ligase [Chloroflexota bacterium]